MYTAATMLLTPKMMQVLMEGLIPFADAVKELLNKKFEGNNFHIGIDAALTIANPSCIAVGILMVPTTIVLAWCYHLTDYFQFQTLRIRQCGYQHIL